MSQMKAYCFKCEAEMDPEAIVCPSCGRLQRSMVVKSVEQSPRDIAPPTTRPPRPEPPPLYAARAPQSSSNRSGPGRPLALLGAGVLGLLLLAFAVGRSCS